MLIFTLNHNVSTLAEQTVYEQIRGL